MAPQVLGSSGAAPGPSLSPSCSSAAAEPAEWPQCSTAASQKALLAEWEGISPAANVKIIPEQPSTPASGRVDVGFIGTQYNNCFAHKCGDPPRQSKGRKETPRADVQCCYRFGLPVSTASWRSGKAPAGSVVPWFLLQNQAWNTLLEAGLSSSQHDSTQQKTQYLPVLNK